MPYPNALFCWSLNSECVFLVNSQDGGNRRLNRGRATPSEFRAALNFETKRGVKILPQADRFFMRSVENASSGYRAIRSADSCEQMQASTNRKKAL